jgi:ribosomal protein S27AE
MSNITLKDHTGKLFPNCPRCGGGWIIMNHVLQCVNNGCIKTYTNDKKSSINASMYYMYIDFFILI